MKLSIISLAIAILVLGFMSISSSASATEKPQYVVAETDDKIEIRDYPVMLLAEVTVSGDRGTAANRGFRKLAAFIFGDNQAKSKISMTSPVVQTSQQETVKTESVKSEKISMTAPVVQKPSLDGTWKVNFMMPSKYSKETLPIPLDTDIRIFETAPYRTVSLRFSGSASINNIRKHQEKLNAYMSTKGMTALSGPEYAFYDAPFVPPMFRRNEVHYRITQ